MLLRVIPLLLLLFTATVSFSQKGTLEMQVMYTRPYCSGARPSPEMEAEALKPKAYNKQKFVLVSESGKSKCVKTDAQGFILVKLKAGSYRVFEYWRYYGKAPAALNLKQMDSECLKQEWKKEAGVVKVSSPGDKTPQIIVIAENCLWATPCLLDSAKPPMPQ